MPIRAVRVMAAGKAGLDALPYFVQAFGSVENSYPQFVPFALDHDMSPGSVLENVTSRTREVIGEEAWRRLYRASGDFGVQITDQDGRIAPLLNKINKSVLQEQIADSPARMGAWSRVSLRQHCIDAFDLWEQFVGDGLATSGDSLLVVIPYCPEGPTSGTVGMYMGAMLRSVFAERGRAHQLNVCGVELCPPHDISQGGNIDPNAAGNIFRGYVARLELLQGVPVTDDPEDTEYWDCFDIDLVFDGGVKVPGYNTPEEIWFSMDRAAAQGAAYLFAGALNGDPHEAAAMLRRGYRWEFGLVHVISERHFNPVIRCLRHRLALPWIRNQEYWDEENETGRRQMFLTWLENTEREIQRDSEPAVVLEWFDHMSQLGDALRRIRGLLGRFTGDQDKIRALLEQAVSDDENLYREIERHNPHHGSTSTNFVVGEEPSAVMVSFSEDMRIRVASAPADAPFADLLDQNGITTVRSRINNCVARFLARRDLQGVDGGVSNSAALFDMILSASIVRRDGPNQTSFPDQVLQPFDEGAIAFFLNPDSRSRSGSRNENNAFPTKNTPMWKPARRQHDLPVEYSFLVLAHIPEAEGFKDVNTYRTMKEYYDQVVGDDDQHQAMVRYYGIRSPFLAPLEPHKEPRVIYEAETIARGEN